MPMATTTATRSSDPATRTTGASGPLACPMGIVARGTPPKGTLQRMNSARVNEPTRPIRLPRPAGTSAAARPKKAAWRSPANTQPGGVRSSIQAVAGRLQAAVAAIVRRNRTAADCPAMSWSKTAMPTKAAGHQPHGGTAAASRRPARIAVEAVRRCGNVGISPERGASAQEL